MSGLFLRTAKPLLCLHFCVLGVRQKGGVFESVRRTDPKKNGTLSIFEDNFFCLSAVKTSVQA